MMINGNKRARAGVAAALGLGVFLLGSNSFAEDSAPAAAAPAAAPPATPATTPADPNAPAAATASEEAKPTEAKAEEPQEEKDYDEGVAGPLRFGPLFSVGVIRPFSIGLTAKYKRYLGFGVDYSFIPTLKLPFADAELSSYGIKGYGRFHPFKGAFYLQVGFGYQSSSGSINASGVVATGEVASPVVDIALGWFWTWKFGLGVGIQLGAGIPLGGTVTTTATGPTAAQAELDNQRQKVQDGLEIVGKIPLPQIDLLKIGFLF